MLEQSCADQSFWRSHVPSQPYRQLSRIKGVGISLLSASDIRRLSVCKVHKTSLHERSLPRFGSINDNRMGTADKKLKCRTCHNNMIVCNGHPGHMELACPVYHIGYISYLLKILRCICPICCRCIDDGPATRSIVSRYADDAKQRFHVFEKYFKTKKQCMQQDCKAYLPKYSQNSLGLKRDWVGKARANLPQPALTPQVVLDLLELVDDEVFEMLGVHGHPRNMIIQTLLVPPPIMRPTINFSESSRNRGQGIYTSH